ncbi:MAG: hypothetical protein IJH34_03525 [Romboutsia sp.]|nr:hypothetical protein [Romboutsia sp.]
MPSKVPGEPVAPPKLNVTATSTPNHWASNVTSPYLPLLSLSVSLTFQFPLAVFTLQVYDLKLVLVNSSVGAVKISFILYVLDLLEFQLPPLGLNVAV